MVETTAIDDIVNDVLNVAAEGVSDDTFKDKFGTVSWILGNTSGSQRIMGNVLIPGFKTDQSAHMSEIGGMYGLMIMVIELIKDLWDLKKEAVTIGCDGINTL